MSQKDSTNQKLDKILEKLEEDIGEIKEDMKSMSHPIDKGVVGLTIAVSEEGMALGRSEAPDGLLDKEANNYVTAFRAMEALRAARDRLVEARGHLAICEAAVHKLVARREKEPAPPEPAIPPDDQNLN